MSNVIGSTIFLIESRQGRQVSYTAYATIKAAQKMSELQAQDEVTRAVDGAVLWIADSVDPEDEERENDGAVFTVNASGKIIHRWIIKAIPFFRR